MNFSVKKAVVLSVASLALFTSCNRNDDPVNPNQEVKDYKFERNGASSVSFGGQHMRIDMHSQVKAYAGSAKSTDITADYLMKLVQNQDNPFVMDGAFYNASDLNGTTKQIWNKVSASATMSGQQAQVQTYFQGLFNDLEYLSSQRGATASNGVAGMYGNRLVDAQGIETVQLMSKSLMGAFELDQIINHYLSDDKLNVDNDQIPQGKNYTAMEHHWDEAFGYTGLPADSNVDITSGDNKSKYKRFWSGYISAVDGSVAGAGIKKDIYNAFIKGRQAIVDKDYAERDKQRDKIVKLMEKVCFIRCAHYLREGADVLENPNATMEQKASAFHEIAEGLGFLYSIDFTPKGQALPANHKGSFYVQMIRQMGLYSPGIAQALKMGANKMAEIGGFNLQDA
ncbi:MAG: hypothetical protein CSA38_00270 [Flavobacteriales bacterium]|nr:MAG: hypothetical protein CSA38_00270 [Flavobacteriales bacterium]